MKWKSKPGNGNKDKSNRLEKLIADRSGITSSGSALRISQPRL